MAPNRLDLLPTEVFIKIQRHLMDDVIHHLDQYVAYVAMDGKVWPLGREWVMTWDNLPIDNRAMKLYGNRYAPRYGCGCLCDNEDGFLTYYCGCGFAEEGASFAGSVYTTPYIVKKRGVVLLWDVRVSFGRQMMARPRVMYV